MPFGTFTRGYGVKAYKRPYMSKPFRAPRASKTNYAARIKRVQNPRTGGFLGLELKFLDGKLLNTALANSNDASGGEMDPIVGACLNAIDSGTGESNRDGRKCLLKSVEVKGQIESNGATGLSAAPKKAYFYIAIVLDTQTNGTQLSSENVFKNIAAISDAAASPVRDLQQLSRFKVIKQITLRAPNYDSFQDGATTGTIGGYQIPFKIYAKINIPVNFIATTGGIADIVDNTLHVIAYTSNSEMSPTMTYGARVRFVG